MIQGQCASTLATVIRVFCMEQGPGARCKQLENCGSRLLARPRWDATGMRLELVLLSSPPRAALTTAKEKYFPICKAKIEAQAQNGQQLSKFVKSCQNCQQLSKINKICQNCPNLFKIIKLVKIVHSHQPIAVA